MYSWQISTLVLAVLLAAAVGILIWQFWPQLTGSSSSQYDTCMAACQGACASKKTDDMKVRIRVNKWEVRSGNMHELRRDPAKPVEVQENAGQFTFMDGRNPIGTIRFDGPDMKYDQVYPPQTYDARFDTDGNIQVYKTVSRRQIFTSGSNFYGGTTTIESPKREWVTTFWVASV